MVASITMPRPRGLAGQLKQAEAALAYWQGQLKMAEGNLTACQRKIEQIEVKIVELRTKIEAERAHHRTH